MPIYADEIPLDDLRKLEKYHVCAECGGLLRLSWSNNRNCYMLRCERFEEHNGIRRLGRDPEILEIKSKLKGGSLPMTTPQAKKATMTTMLARVDQARFPKDLTNPEKQLIAAVSIEYGLDPVFGELMIYQGRPYVTIDARRRKAQETGNLDGISARPATNGEKKARRVPDEDYLFVAEVWVKGAEHSFEGWGRVKDTETKGDVHLPIVKDPAAQAEKRAEAQALRRAFHLPLPSFEEIIEGEFEEVPPGKAPPGSKIKTPTTPTTPTTSAVVNRATPAQLNKITTDAAKMDYIPEAPLKMAQVFFKVEKLEDLSIPQASELINMIGRGESIPALGLEEGEEK